MSEPTSEQRAMAADLSERAARILRSPDAHSSAWAWSEAVDEMACMAREILDPGVRPDAGSDTPAALYANGLSVAGVTDEECDAAVADILAGKHPPGSLPARLIELCRDAERERKARDEWAESADARVAFYEGGVRAFGEALDLLGCAPSKEPT